MTIDEAIKDIQENIKPIVGGKSLDIALEALNELQWYRRQDLICRKDALERIERLKSAEKHFDHVIILHHSYCAIGEIPKAEPTLPNTPNTLERVGDCETCKHYGTEVCGECFKSMGESKYEPYIPKENEL